MREPAPTSRSLSLWTIRSSRRGGRHVDLGSASRRERQHPHRGAVASLYSTVVSSPRALRQVRGGHVRAVARSRRWTSITRDHARLPRWSTARNNGVRYPADSPKIEELIAAMHSAGDYAQGLRCAR